jgi:hypothetical protein
MRWWHSFGLFVTFAAAHAETCAPVDLRAKIGPPLHQGDSGYCFAHSSSTLIQARLGVRVSPMSLAMGYLLATPDDLSGAADEAVKARLTPAFFDQWHRDRTEDPQNYGPGRILTEKGLIDTGGDELQTLAVANFFGLCDESRLPTGETVYKKYLKSIAAYHARRVRNGTIPPEERERAIGEITDPEARAMAWSFRHWVERRCGTPRPPRIPLVPTELFLAPSLKSFRRVQRLGLAATLPAQNKLLAAINRQLDRGNPVSIGYALSDIMPEQASVLAGSPVPAEVDHASVLAGRRTRGGRCYYYLRNSFGTDSGYASFLRGRYEDGGVWVLPEEIPSLYSAAWLE